MAVTAIDNATIVYGGRLRKAHILVKDGKIESVGLRKSRQVDRRIDVKGKVVLPGLVDGHAHLHDPAYLNREDFTSGTIAAVAGGVTTVVEMVLSTPVDTPDRVRLKSRLENAFR